MLGIIGGTGLYKIDGIKNVQSSDVTTPFGSASARVTTGELNGKKVAFLPRHGTGHQILPSEINYRSNIWALKAAGVRQIIGVSAVGSLREDIRPGDLVLPDQYFDATKGARRGSFFGNGIVAHVSTAEPTCPALAKRVDHVGQKTGVTFHQKKTYACVEGPRLGTKAESHYLRQIGCDVVGMTNIPEAFLAREAQLCYLTIAVATDYDCWMEDASQHASVDKVIELYMRNIFKVTELVQHVVSDESPPQPCTCQSSLKHALLTDVSLINEEQKQYLAFLME